MPRKPGPVDPVLRVFKYGLDGTEPEDLILRMLTWLVPADRKREHQAGLREVLAEVGFDKPRLVTVLWKVVTLGLPISQARGDRENAVARAEWKQKALAILPVLTWLEHETDDRLWEYARPLRRRLEELKKDPSQWRESWITPPDPRRARRPQGGNPYFDVKPQAKRLLADVGYKDSPTQLRYLRLLGMEPPRGRHRF